MSAEHKKKVNFIYANAHLNLTDLGQKSHDEFDDWIFEAFCIISPVFIKGSRTGETHLFYTVHEGKLRKIVSPAE